MMCCGLRLVGWFLSEDWIGSLLFGLLQLVDEGPPKSHSS